MREDYFTTTGRCMTAYDKKAFDAAHDQKIDLGVSTEEVERQRPAVVQLAATIAERLRAEHAARQRAAQERADV